jgi:hypothetical protein
MSANAQRWSLSRSASAAGSVAMRSQRTTVREGEVHAPNAGPWMVRQGRSEARCRSVAVRVHATSSPRQSNGAFGACSNAQSARPTRVSIRRVRDFESMHPHFESVQYPERSIVLAIDASNVEYTFRTDPLTIAFPFAAFQIDDRIDDPGLLFAGRHGTAQVLPSRRPQRAA